MNISSRSAMLQLGNLRMFSSGECDKIFFTIKWKQIYDMFWSAKKKQSLQDDVKKGSLLFLKAFIVSNIEFEK